MPALKAGGVSGGAYIGVGPDQNFSYIAQIKPAIAFIIDIRRDNLLLHLLFKALFAMSRNRVEYLGLLTGRVLPERLDTLREASLDRVVTAIDNAKVSRRKACTVSTSARTTPSPRLGVPLSAADFTTIQRFHHTFIASGLALKFESLGRRPQAVYPSFRDLIVATDRNGQAAGFLATDAGFQFVKSLEARDLVVPVVGNLGGPHAAGRDRRLREGARRARVGVLHLQRRDLPVRRYGRAVRAQRRPPAARRAQRDHPLDVPRLGERAEPRADQPVRRGEPVITARRRRRSRAPSDRGAPRPRVDGGGAADHGRARAGRR